MTTCAVELRRPGPGLLPAYVEALERGWSPDNVRGRAAADEQRARIAADPAVFIAALEDREGRGAAVTLPDGRTVRRIPGFTRWIWEAGFCGSIGFRWTPGSEALPEHVLGHVGYAVVPWMRGRGYATAGLRLLLPESWREGLRWIELTTDSDNIPSQKVILANGGRCLGPFTKPEAFGGGEGLRWRIDRPAQGQASPGQSSGLDMNSIGARRR